MVGDDLTPEEYQRILAYAAALQAREKAEQDHDSTALITAGNDLITLEETIQAGEEDYGIDGKFVEEARRKLKPSLQGQLKLKNEHCAGMPMIKIGETYAKAIQKDVLEAFPEGEVFIYARYKINGHPYVRIYLSTVEMGKTIFLKRDKKKKVTREIAKIELKKNWRNYQYTDLEVSVYADWLLAVCGDTILKLNESFPKVLYKPSLEYSLAR